MNRLSVLVLLLVAAAAPAQDMPLSQILIDGETWKPVKTSGKVTALASDAKGNLYLGFAGEKKIVQLGIDGKEASFAETSAAVSRLALSPTGEVYAVLSGKGQVARYGTAGKEKLLEDIDGVGDVAIARGREVYFTVPAKKAVYQVDRKRPVAENINAPAGLVFWVAGGTLVVGDASTRYLHAFRRDKDGTLSAGDKYYPLRVRPKQGSGVAALTLDEKKRLYAAAKEGVQVFDPTGRLCGLMVPPKRAAVTAIAFGGAKRDLLYIVCDEVLYSRKVQTPGAVWAPKGKK